MSNCHKSSFSEKSILIFDFFELFRKSNIFCFSVIPFFVYSPYIHNYNIHIQDNYITLGVFCSVFHYMKQVRWAVFSVWSQLYIFIHGFIYPFFFFAVYSDIPYQSSNILYILHNIQAAYNTVNYANFTKSANFKKNAWHTLQGMILYRHNKTTAQPVESLPTIYRLRCPQKQKSFCIYYYNM